MKDWTPHQLDCLEVMGVTFWQAKNQSASQKTAKTVDPLVFQVDQGVDKNHVKPTKTDGFINNVNPTKTLPSWQDIQKSIISCKQCKRANASQSPLVGQGNNNASIVVIVDAPSIGQSNLPRLLSEPAEQLLIRMLGAIDIDYQSVYISNFVKCPSALATVQVEDYQYCLTHLKQQLDNIQPSLLLVFSEQAAQFILNNHSPLALLRQQVHQSINAIKTIVTHSPQAVLDDVSKKRDVWQDLKLVKKIIEDFNIE